MFKVGDKVVHSKFKEYFGEVVEVRHNWNGYDVCIIVHDYTCKSFGINQTLASYPPTPYKFWISEPDSVQFMEDAASIEIVNTGSGYQSSETKQPHRAGIDPEHVNWDAVMGGGWCGD